MVTDTAGDQEDSTVVSVAHRAFARTWYVPVEAQDLEALVEELQDENVPSPQSKRYCTLWPAAQVEPPVE